MVFFTGTGLVVKLVLIILIYFSVVSWAIIFYKLLQVYRANRESERFLEFFWKTKRFDTISTQLDRFPNSPLSLMFNEGYTELKKLMEAGGDQQVPGRPLRGVTVPRRTFFFGGKAAPAYHFAKLVIKFINSLAATIDGDPAVREKLR